jgi:bacteriocin-like protein
MLTMFSATKKVALLAQEPLVEELSDEELSLIIGGRSNGGGGWGDDWGWHHHHHHHHHGHWEWEKKWEPVWTKVWESGCF